MELGRHLGKGLWGLADKTLPVLYGFGFAYLVVRVLSEEEYGNWVLIQEIFLLITGMATAIALNPIMKFGAESGGHLRSSVTVGVVLQAGFMVISSLLILALRGPLGAVQKFHQLAMLVDLIPLMLAASFIRNLALVVLQSQFMVRELFVTDAIHFLGAPFLIWVWSKFDLFDQAVDLVWINIISLSASSLVGLVLARHQMKMTLRPVPGSLSTMWRYGVYSLGGTVSSLFSSRADSFLLAAFTGPIEVAVYTSAKFFVRAYEMVAQVFQMFLLPGVSRLNSKGDTVGLKAVTEKALMFGNIVMVPVLLGFVFLAGPMVRIVYQGRYLEAIPQLQIFALLSFVVTATSVGSNVLLGLGEARKSFILGMQSLVASIIAYVVLIPLFGVTGATLGYVLSMVILAVLSIRVLREFMPITVAGVWKRWRDVDNYVRRILSGLTDQNQQ